LIKTINEVFPDSNRRGSPRVIITEIDEETSERYDLIKQSFRRKGTPIQTNDLWIAASAIQHGLKALTTDKHYLEVTQMITEYFDAE